MDDEFVAVVEHEPLEISGCGKYIRSRYEPECVLDIRACRGKWVRLATTPEDAVCRRRRLIRLDYDMPRQLPSQGCSREPEISSRSAGGGSLSRRVTSCFLFILSAAGAAVATSAIMRCDNGGGANMAAKWNATIEHLVALWGASGTCWTEWLASLLASNSTNEHWTCDL